MNTGDWNVMTVDDPQEDVDDHYWISVWGGWNHESVGLIKIIIYSLFTNAEWRPSKPCWISS